MHEIERKFLVTRPLDEIVAERFNSFQITQCYLGDTGKWTVRVRRSVDLEGAVKCVKTMKRKVTDRKNIEIEHEIDPETFEKIRSLCDSSISKVRSVVLVGEHIWEVDSFPALGGLVLAEIELASEDEEFLVPQWLGREVTDDRRYRNAQLARQARKQKRRQHL